MPSLLTIQAQNTTYTTEVDGVTELEWSALLERFADASLYQTWAYGAVSWGEKQLSHLVLKRDGDPAALAQLRLVRVPLARRGLAYLRWGPVCTRAGGGWDETVCREMMRSVVSEYVSRRRMVLRIVPRQVKQDAEGTCFVQICQELGFQQDHDVKPYHTFRVDLSQPSEVIRKRFDQKWRNQLNAAERNGMEILCGTSDELYDKFLVLYADMMARKQFQTTVDVHEFRRIQARLPAKQKMLIMISLLEGKPMTGLVSTAVGENGIYLLGATSTEGMRSKGSYLLQWQMVQQLKERGCRWYDLGGINPEENPGVYHFKQGMGGEEVHGHGRTTLSTGRVGRVAVAGAERLRNFVKLLRGQRWALKRR